MANIIDTSYFVGNISLPVDQLTGQLNNYILRFEPEILTKILGYDLKKQFVEALAGTPDQKWIDLRDGKDYQIDGIYYNWRGFLNTKKESIIANYVWFEFVTSENTYVSGAGIKQIVTENSQFANPRVIQLYNYNKMIDWIDEMKKFIEKNISDYTNYNPEFLLKINQFNF